MKIQLLKVAAFALLQTLAVHANNGDDGAVYASDDDECNALIDEGEELVKSSPGCRLVKALFDDEDIMGGTTQDVQGVSLSSLLHSYNDMDIL